MNHDPYPNSGYGSHLRTEEHITPGSGWLLDTYTSPPEANLTWVGCLVSAAALAMTAGGIIFGLTRLAKRRRRA